MLLDRLLTKCSERLSIFAAPVVLDRDYDISADACDIVLDIVRQNVPFVAVDLPHTWTPWVKRVLLQADEIVITAVPDLANLRNAKNLDRSAEAEPHQRRAAAPGHEHGQDAEAARDLSEGVLGRARPRAVQVIEFDSETFGLAANNGQMIEEFSGKAKPAQQFRELALLLGRTARSRRKTRRSRPRWRLGPFSRS